MEVSMKKSSRLLALFLALVMLIGALTSCDLINSSQSPGSTDDEKNDSGNPIDCPHLWMDGICRLCTARCKHEWVPGGCKICDAICYHNGIHENEICSTCSKDLRDAPFNVTVTTNCESNVTSGTSTFGRAESLKEIFIHVMTSRGYRMYISTNLVNVYVNGTLVTDYNTVITEDCSLRIELKENVVRIALSVIGNRDSESDIIYIPSGMPLSLIGDILYPEKGGISYLFSIAKVEIDGAEVSDPSYVISKSSNIKITLNEGSGGMRSYIVSFTDHRTGKTSELEFEKGITVGDAIQKLMDMQDVESVPLEQLLLMGDVIVNGERISKNELIDKDSKIEFKPFSGDTIRIAFLASPDLGKGEKVECSQYFTTGITFEKVIEEMLGISWEAYTESYYNTRITTYGSHETWIAVDKDTVFTESHSIGAIKYKDEPRQDKVYLNIGFSFLGVEAQVLELDYDTTLSKAFDSIGVDLNILLDKAELYINTYRLVGDARIKYDSFIYGWTVCEHEWKDRTCMKCGTYCQSEYYGDGNCGTCGSYHPSNDPNVKYVYVEIYSSVGVLIESHNVDFYSYIKAYTVFDDLGYRIADGYVYLDGKLIDEAEYLELFGGEKIKYVLKYDEDTCYHYWTGDVCAECGAVCGHLNVENNTCMTCGSTLINVIFTEEIKGAVVRKENYVVTAGTNLYNFAVTVGHTMDDVENGYFRVDGEVRRIWFLNGDCTVTYYVPCSHTYDKGVCSNCGKECEHQRQTMFPNLCAICGMDIGYPDIPPAPPCDHVWKDSRCTMCHDWCNSDLSHTFKGGICTNCGCEYAKESHYVLVIYEEYTYYVQYGMNYYDFLAYNKGFYYSSPCHMNYQIVLGAPSATAIVIDDKTLVGALADRTEIYIVEKEHVWDKDNNCINCGIPICDHSKMDGDVCVSCGFIDYNRKHLYLTYEGETILSASRGPYSLYTLFTRDYRYQYDERKYDGYWVLETENGRTKLNMQDFIYDIADGARFATLVYVKNEDGNADCSHDWADGNNCSVCGTPAPDVSVKYVRFIDGRQLNVVSFTVAYGTQLSILMDDLHINKPISDVYTITINGHLYYGGYMISDNICITLVTTQENCQHYFREGYCLTCELSCEHEILSYREHCQICGMLVNPDAYCPHPLWYDSICTQCEERCFHPTFTGCSCNVCDYVSDGVENPVFVTYLLNQYIVPEDMPVKDFIINVLYISYETSLTTGYWEWIGHSTSAYEVPEDAKFSDLGHRFISLYHRKSEVAPCDHYWLGGKCTYCEMQCSHQVVVECECITCHMEVPRKYYTLKITNGADTVTTEYTTYKEMSGEELLKILGIEDASNYLFYVNNDYNVTYDATAFKLNTFPESCTVDAVHI